MPNHGAFADFVVLWQRLVTNTLANSAELPEQIAVYRAGLEQVLARVFEKSARLRIRRGVKQQEQKELEEEMRNGRFHASKLKAALIAHHGPQSERLLDYDIKPRRSKPRPAGETEEPEPEIEIQEVKTVEAPKPEDPTSTPQGKPAE